MSSELDEMYSAMLSAQVPPNWRSVSYPSLKPLSSWIADLNERVTFMDNWLKNGNPACYWISGFFFPQGFMTGTLQTHARKLAIPIDRLSFSFNVLDDTHEQITQGAADGIFIYGLFLEGARWEEDDKNLAEQYPGEMYSIMPVIHFLPTDNYETSPDDYPCPLYKTSERAGVLSTTGQSTNFVIAVDLPTEELPEHWTLKGTALLCQLNT